MSPLTFLSVCVCVCLRYPSLRHLFANPESWEIGNPETPKGIQVPRRTSRHPLKSRSHFLLEPEKREEGS